MPKATATTTVPAVIPFDANRKSLRWRIATTADGGSAAFVSMRRAADATDAACGVKYEPGEGERLADLDARKAIFILAVSGTAVVWWDAENLPTA
jgi:hypothetical protein